MTQGYLHVVFSYYHNQEIVALALEHQLSWLVRYLTSLEEPFPDQSSISLDWLLNQPEVTKVECHRWSVDLTKATLCLTDGLSLTGQALIQRLATDLNLPWLQLKLTKTRESTNIALLRYLVKVHNQEVGPRSNLQVFNQWLSKRDLPLLKSEVTSLLDQTLLAWLQAMQRQPELPVLLNLQPLLDLSLNQEVLALAQQITNNGSVAHPAHLVLGLTSLTVSSSGLTLYPGLDNSYKLDQLSYRDALELLELLEISGQGHSNQARLGSGLATNASLLSDLTHRLAKKQ